MTHKLAIVVGHNAKAKGAIRQDTGESEFHYNSRLAAMIEKESRLFPEISVQVFFRKYLGHRAYYAEISDVYKRTDAWGADSTCELHFNSHHNPQATGTETLTSGTRSSTKMALNVQRRMLEAFGLKDRGLKTVRTGRGSASLMSGKAPAILIEPFFGSSPEGLKATDEPHEMQALARAILHGVQDAFV